MSEADTGAQEAADKAAAEAAAKGTDGTAFDAERAKATIETQRKAEKALKAELKEAQKAAAELAELKQAQADAEKTAQELLAEREATVAAKDAQIAKLQVQHDFEVKAAGLGIADPALAYLAAEQQGLLGNYDPKAGTVGEHNWEMLGEKYPSFATQSDDAGGDTGGTDSGDAGKQRRGKAMTTADQFNQAVRGSIRG